MLMLASIIIIINDTDRSDRHFRASLLLLSANAIITLVGAASVCRQLARVNVLVIWLLLIGESSGADVRLLAL